jgi:PAS domain S-box-containing protein
MSELDYRDAQIVALATRVRELEEREVQREGRFQVLIQSLEVGIVVLGRKSELVLCNPRALQLLGLSEAQLRGLSSMEASWNMLSEDGLPLAAEDRPIAQACKTKQPVRDVLTCVAHGQQAERVCLGVSAVPQLDEHGELSQVVVTFTNLTAYRQAKR